jgi:integrase
MPRSRSIDSPRYLLHKATGQARVIIDGKTHYLGAYGSPASIEKYNRLVAEYLNNGRSLPPRTSPTGGDPNAITIAEMVANYTLWAKDYYGEGKRGEFANMKLATRPLVELFGSLPAVEFAPQNLTTIQAVLARQVCRNLVNARVRRIRRVFKWAVAQGLVAANVWHALLAVAALRLGRMHARETDPVKPVAKSAVGALEKHVSTVVWSMIELQRLTGCRPGEVVIMRTCDLDTTGGKTWEYRPARHKTQHHGKQRVILLGPKAIGIVKKYLRPGNTAAYLFSPAEAIGEIRERRHKARATPMDLGNKPGSNRRRNPKHPPAERYTTNTYAQAIARGCDQAFPPPAQRDQVLDLRIIRSEANHDVLVAPSCRLSSFVTGAPGLVTMAEGEPGEALPNLRPPRLVHRDCGRVSSLLHAGGTRGDQVGRVRPRDRVDSPHHCSRADADDFLYHGPGCPGSGLEARLRGNPCAVGRGDHCGRDSKSGGGPGRCSMGARAAGNCMVRGAGIVGLSDV